ncbi:hypothetical protein B566_EDAN000897 [Ephemera danica]|nr:hypothetical protein B566_EDAN000897 [Ephemera danica]
MAEVAMVLPAVAMVRVEVMGNKDLTMLEAMELLQDMDPIASHNSKATVVTASHMLVGDRYLNRQHSSQPRLGMLVIRLLLPSHPNKLSNKPMGSTATSTVVTPAPVDTSELTIVISRYHCSVTVVSKTIEHFLN